MELKKIKEHWEKSGEMFPLDSKVTPTSRDPYLGELEQENVKSHLKKEYNCLEIGCGDAFHTVHYSKSVKCITGVDVAESLINVAKRRVEQEKLTNVSLAACSVLELEDYFKGKKFDCAISQRCLINLPDWEYQKKAILQVYNLLSDEGIFILTEGFQENLDNLNEVRKKYKLQEIKVVDYNRNFFIKEFEEFIPKYFEVLDKHYYGAYLFFSRVYHPLAVMPENPKHDSRLNEVGMMLQKEIDMPDLNKYSYNIAYVLKKKI